MGSFGSRPWIVWDAGSELAKISFQVPEPSKLPDISRPLMVEWAGHALRAGAALGATLGILGASIRWLGRGAEDAPLTVSTLGGAALVTTAVGALGLLALASLTWPLLRFRTGRFVAISLHAFVAAAFAGVHLTSNVLRALSGSYLTLGAVDFMLAGGLHLVRTIALGYAPWLSLLALAVALVAATVAVATGRQLQTAGVRRGRRSRSDLARFSAPAGIASIGLLPLGLMPDLALASAEAAFAASLSPTPLDASADSRDDYPANAVAGPPLVEGARWLDAAKSGRPLKSNVLLLTLESVSIRHLGYFGYERPTTPNLDRIAARSLRLRRAWSTATHSNYAQMAILSSLFPRRTAGLDTYRQLDYPRVLLHDVFHQLGYSTATISSQNETWQGMLRFQQTGTPTHFRHALDYEGLRIDIGSEMVVQDHVTTEMALDWVEKQSKTPWSLYVNLQATHFPYRLPPESERPFEPTETTRGRFNYLGYPEHDRQAAVNRYDNALRYVDEQVGKIERGLERLGQLENTIWVITSDHGEAFHDHGQVTHGKTLFDSEARVPLLVHFPAGLKPADVEEPVSNLDVLPTVVDLLGLPPHPAFQGKSFAAPSARASETPAVVMNIQGLRSAEAVVCWPWKLIVNRSARSAQLYNLEHDPDETEDRLQRDPEVASALRSTLSRMVAAQMSYHRAGNPERRRRYAPRLPACPALPEVQRASATPPAREPTTPTRSPELSPDPAPRPAKLLRN